MFYTDDPVKDFERHDRAQEKLLEQLPICDDCGKRIGEDYYFDIDAEILCEDCVIERYRRNTNDY